MNIKFQNQGRLSARTGMTLVEVMMALAVAGLTVAGVVEGYIYCTKSSAKDALYMAANSRAVERLEEVRTAQWDTTSYPAVDELVATNFPDETVTLDKTAADPVHTPATLKTYITQLSTPTPLKEIRVDCIWQFQGDTVTNTIETCRAPD